MRGVEDDEVLIGYDGSTYNLPQLLSCFDQIYQYVQCFSCAWCHRRNDRRSGAMASILEGAHSRWLDYSTINMSSEDTSSQWSDDSLRLLENGSIDALYGMWYVKEKRAESFYYATPFRMEKMAIVFRDDSQMLRFDSLMAGIPHNIYAIVAIAVLLLLILALASFKLHEVDKFDKSASMWHYMELLLPTGHGRLPFGHRISMSARVVTLSMTLIIIFTVYYKCYLLEHIIVRQPRRTIYSEGELADIIEENKLITIFLRDETHIVQSKWIHGEESTVPQLSRAIKRNGRLTIKHREEAVARVMQGEHVFIDDMGDIVSVMSRHQQMCRHLAVVTIEELGSTWSSLLLSNRSMRLRERMNVRVARRYSFLGRSFSNGECPHDYPPKIEHSPLTFVAFRAALLLYSVGVSIACLVILAEVARRRYRGGQRQSDGWNVTVKMCFHIAIGDHKLRKAYAIFQRRMAKATVMKL